MRLVFTLFLMLVLAAAGTAEVSKDLRVVAAAGEGDWPAVRALTKQKADVNAAQGDGMTPLHWAAFRNDLEAARFLLAAGAKVDAATRAEGLTPLHMACANGSASMVKALLKAGASPNTAAANGTTVLMTAASSGSGETVQVLLEAGADANAKETTHAETALMFAAAKNRPDAVKALMSKGADAKAVTNVVKLERQRVDEDGNPLPQTREGTAQGARRLDNLGGQARGTFATVMGGMTALLLAARDGHKEAVQALVEAGADVNQVSAGDKSSPLVIAISNGHYELAQYLLDHGADPNLASIDGLAALYATVDTEWAQVGWAPNPITTQERVSHLDLLKSLLEHGANANARLTRPLWFRPTSHNQEWVDKKGATPFWRAAQSTDVPAMKILIAGGADPKIATEEGVTPLMAAAGLGWGANASRNAPDSWLAAVKYCFELGIDVNAKDTYNYTALHGAAYRGDNEVVRFLAEKGAKLDVRSKRGQAVTDMANGPLVNAHLPMGHPDTVALLQKLGAPPPELPSAGAPKPVRAATK